MPKKILHVGCPSPSRNLHQLALTAEVLLTKERYKPFKGPLFNNVCHGVKVGPLHKEESTHGND